MQPERYASNRSVFAWLNWLRNRIAGGRVTRRQSLLAGRAQAGLILLQALEDTSLTALDASTVRLYVLTAGAMSALHPRTNLAHPPLKSLFALSGKLSLMLAQAGSNTALPGLYIGAELLPIGSTGTLSLALSGLGARRSDCQQQQRCRKP